MGAPRNEWPDRMAKEALRLAMLPFPNHTPSFFSMRYAGWVVFIVYYTFPLCDMMVKKNKENKPYAIVHVSCTLGKPETQNNNRLLVG